MANLVSYESSDDDDEQESEQEQGLTAAAIAAAAAAAAVNGEEEEEEEEEVEEETRPPFAHDSSGAVEAPTTLPAAAPAAASLPAAATTSELPTPDLSWVESSAHRRPTVPQLSSLGKAKRGGGGSAQISRGFTPAMTRQEQLARAQASEMAGELEAKERNYGLSSAYDSVFHVDRDEADEGRPAAQVSKKEARRNAALEDKLRG